MTRLISIVIVAAVLWVAWRLAQYWQEVQAGREAEQKEAAAKTVRPEHLPGMPYELQTSLDAAENQGPAALKSWLQNYNRYLADPRKAWIELDYCVMVARTNPKEARRIFAAVKERTPHSSPVWPRIRELAPSYE